MSASYLIAILLVTCVCATAMGSAIQDRAVGYVAFYAIMMTLGIITVGLAIVRFCP